MEWNSKDVEIEVQILQNLTWLHYYHYHYYIIFTLLPIYNSLITNNRCWSTPTNVHIVTGQFTCLPLYKCVKVLLLLFIVT